MKTYPSGGFMANKLSFTHQSLFTDPQVRVLSRFWHYMWVSILLKDHFIVQMHFLYIQYNLPVRTWGEGGQAYCGLLADMGGGGGLKNPEVMRTSFMDGPLGNLWQCAMFATYIQVWDCWNEILILYSFRGTQSWKLTHAVRIRG